MKLSFYVVLTLLILFLVAPLVGTNCAWSGGPIAGFWLWAAWLATLKEVRSDEDE